MKTLSILFTILLAGTATAGVRIETVIRDLKTKVAQGANTILVQDGKVRFGRGEEGGMILKGGVMYMVDDKRKTYREMDQATMKASMDQAGEAMKKMQERMAKMTPEQRAQMEQMMGGNMPGMAAPGNEPVYAAKDTGKSDTVEGRKCRVWHLLKDNLIEEDLCVVPFNTLPGNEDFEKTFKELAEAFASMAASVPGAGVGNAVKARNSIKGYPVRTRPYLNGKLQGTEIVLTKWVEESIPATTFDVPKGYKKQKMPRMGD